MYLIVISVIRDILVVIKIVSNCSKTIKTFQDNVLVGDMFNMHKLS